MADQSIQFLEGIAKDIMVKIQDHYAPADFMILDMEEEDDSPIILGRALLNTTNVVIYIGSGHVHFQFPKEKVCCYFNNYTLLSSRRSPALGGDVDHPTDKRINSLRMDRGDYEVEVVKDQHQPRWNKWDDEEPKAPIKEEATPPKSSPQTKQSMEREGNIITVTKRHSRLSLHHRDQMMHLKSKHSLLPSPIRRILKSKPLL
jgi:hypothetical protein